MLGIECNRRNIELARRYNELPHPGIMLKNKFQQTSSHSLAEMIRIYHHPGYRQFSR
ncbi:hypothetical protein D3C81_1254070 [compost metagenome]